MNLYQAFKKVALGIPEKTVVYYGEDETSYLSLLKSCRNLGALLQHQYGIEPGARVGIWMKNRPEFLTSLWGIFAAGGVAVPVSSFFKPEEASYLISDAEITTLITDSDLAGMVDFLCKRHPALKIIKIDQDKLPEADSNWKEVERNESDLACLVYTSGTTGRPKGAMLSHGNFLHNVRSCQQVLKVEEEDRFALLLPMYHSFMLCVCEMVPLLSGASIVLIKSLHPPRNTLMEMIKHKATILPGVPAFFRSLVAAQIPEGMQWPLRLCVSGAAPLPLQTLNAFNEKFSFPLIEGYGLSEASPVVSFNPIDGERKPGSIGLQIPDVEVNIQDEDGNSLADKEIGELCVRGGNVMQGYWNQPEETEAVLKDGGWLRTGDIGYRDEDGYFFITDRKKDMLLVNGINVYPREIEEVIYHFPGVKEAAVIGKPDPRKGEIPVAFIVLNEGEAWDEKAISAYLREQIADYKLPRRLKQLESLPRNATGKVLKTELRKLDID